MESSPDPFVHLATVLPIAAVSLLVLYVIYLLIPKKFANAPPLVNSSPVVNIPIIGTALEFGKSPIKMVERCYEQYGPVFTVQILHKRLTFLVGPTAQEPFFKCSDDYLSQNEVYGFMKPVFGPNVVYDATRKNRQTQFQSMANGLRAARLKGYVPKIERETRQFLAAEWKDEGEVDLLHALSDLTILTASRCLHGDDVRETLFKEVSQLYHDLDNGLTPLTVFWPNAPIPAHFTRNKARKKMIELFSGVIKNRRDHPDKQHSDGTDILSIFMNVKYKDGTPITDAEVTGLLIALLFAGQHTSCITSTWTALFLATHPEVLKKMLNEQDKVFGDDPTAPLDYDKVGEMPYLQDCMRETLRLCPPLILLIRKAMRPVPVKTGTTQYIIPKDDMVFVSPSVAMRLPDVFPNPNTFEPERYGPGREEHKTPYAYLGFGGGMHSCMGQNFAYLQVKTIMSVLFREYEIELLGDMPDIDYEAMVVGPKGDCRVRYKKRKVPEVK